MENPKPNRMAADDGTAIGHRLVVESAWLAGEPRFLRPEAMEQMRARRLTRRNLADVFTSFDPHRATDRAPFGVEVPFVGLPSSTITPSSGCSTAIGPRDRRWWGSTWLTSDTSGTPPPCFSPP